MKNVLFLPFPLKISLRLMHLMFFLGKPLSKLFPYLSHELAELESEMNEAEYTSVGLLAFLFYLIVTSSLVSVLLFLVHKLSASTLMVAIAIGFFIGLSVFGLILVYPKLLLERKNNELESYLLFALRQLSIQSSAGVPVFAALASLTTGFGLVSKEFQQVIRDVEGGVSFPDALEKSGLRNPSVNYRRVVWQLSNAIKAGVELPDVLNNVVDALSEEQKISFKKFGSQLSPLALMYLLLTIIGPTLGLIFLIVIVSFLSFNINESVLGIILFGLVLIQFFFIGLISSRRPNIVV
ncbi:MAG: type II secretion system F family protein [Candidatus Micrarchaeota archaeon]